MKKGWKVFWITCGAVVAVGCVCCMIALGLGVTSGAILDRFPNGIGIIGYGSESYSGNGRNVSETYKDISDISVQLSAGELLIKESDTDEVKLEVSNMDSRLKFKYYVDENELIIETRKNLAGLIGGVHKYGTVCLYLPKDFSMNEVDLEIGAGELYVDNISAQDFNVDVGAGEANISNFKVTEADFSCGTGSITASGAVDVQLDAECGIGEMGMTLAGRKEDYSYKLQCGIGDITLGEESYSGLASDKQIYNNTGKEINIDCGIGEVTVDFNQL